MFSCEINDKLVEFTLNHTVRDGDGRLIMPSMWNNSVSHLLGKHLDLAEKINLNQILRSTQKGTSV